MMQTGTQRIHCSQKRKKLIANQFSRSKVIDCVGELHKALELLALRDIAFSQLAMKE
jgi:hypothetical protein